MKHTDKDTLEEKLARQRPKQSVEVRKNVCMCVCVFVVLYVCEIIQISPAFSVCYLYAATVDSRNLELLDFFNRFY